MAEVGWGRVSTAQIADLSNLHALEFALTARPPVIAAAGARALLGEIDAALLDPGGPRFAVFVGHDSNLAYIGGALAYIGKPGVLLKTIPVLAAGWYSSCGVAVTATVRSVCVTARKALPRCATRRP